MIRIQFDQGRFARDMARVAGLLDKSIFEIARQQAGLLAVAALRLTPPTGNAPMRESMGEQKKAGERATTRDTGRVFQPIRKLKFLDSGGNFGKAIDKLLAKGDFHLVEALLRKIGFSHFLGVLPEPDYSKHQALRDGRGRVNRGRTGYFIAKTASLTRYVRARIKSVGYAKSGWITALEKLGRPVPAWVGRHRGNGGYFERGNPPEIIFWNSVPYIQWAYDRIVRRAVDERQTSLALQVRKLERILERKLKTVP